MAISCVDSLSDISLTDPDAINNAVYEIEECIAAAHALRCKYVRIHACGEDKGEATDAAVRRMIRRLLPAAISQKVVLLVETTGVYSDTERLCELLNSFASDRVGALWDMHHPYRYCGETPETTIQRLGAYVKHVHIKDSIRKSPSEVEFCLMGDGDLPVAEMLDALESVGYGGYISYECDPGVFDELGDADIVLPHFISYMQKFGKKATAARSRLPENRSRTGRFVWPKNELIDLTFPQVLDRMVEEFPDQLAFKYTTLDYTRTYSQFRDDVDNFARALIAMGVGVGDHVAIWATNVPAWFITFWAATKIGAVLVTVNTAYKIHEAEYLFRQSDTHTLVMIESCRDSDYRAIINEICPEIASTPSGEPLHCKRLPFLRNVVTVGFSMAGGVTFDDAMRMGESVPAEEVSRRAAAVRPDDVANMQYTSGTTGFPKGVMLTHRNIVNNGKCIGDRMDLSTADRMMIQVPMFHCFGMVLSMTSSMTHGATLLPMPYFSPKSSLACVQAERITVFNGVPTMFIAMQSHPDFAKTDFSYMRTGIMAGANCPADLMRRAADEMNMKEI